MVKISSIKGHFDGRSVVLDEPATLVAGQSVRILIESDSPKDIVPQARPSLAGFAKGMFEMRDDFNDVLDEFSEYR